jgi:hypothetical protein
MKMITRTSSTITQGFTFRGRSLIFGDLNLNSNDYSQISRSPQSIKSMINSRFTHNSQCWISNWGYSELRKKYWG